MTTDQISRPEGNEIDDFDEDAFLDRLGIEGCTHMLLVCFGDEERIEAARHLHSHCLLCRRGVPDDALRAFFVDDDSSLLQEFLAASAH
jgi:hypothetical protein